MTDDRKTEPDAPPEGEPSKVADDAKKAEEASATARPAPTVIDDRATEDEPAPAARPGKTHIASVDPKPQRTRTLDDARTVLPARPVGRRAGRGGVGHNGTLLLIALGIVAVLGVAALIVVSNEKGSKPSDAKTSHANATSRPTATQTAAPTNQPVEAPQPPTVTNPSPQAEQPGQPGQPPTPGQPPPRPGTAAPGIPAPAWIPTVIPSTLGPLPSGIPNIIPSTLPPIPSTFPMPQQPPP